MEKNGTNKSTIYVPALIKLQTTIKKGKEGEIIEGDRFLEKRPLKIILLCESVTWGQHGKS